MIVLESNESSPKGIPLRHVILKAIHHYTAQMGQTPTILIVSHLIWEQMRPSENTDFRAAPLDRGIYYNGLRVLRSSDVQLAVV